MSSRGSRGGKTTTARRLAELLRSRGRRCGLFLEGDPQPADLAWQWWVGVDEFADLIRRWPEAADSLQRASWQGLAGVSVAYNQLDWEQFGADWAGLERAMVGREPFNGAVSPERFVDLLATRWSEFGADESDRPGLVVFEAALLQDTLVELVLFAEWDEERIAAALQRLVAGVAQLGPLVLRLVAEDPRATIAAVATERVDAQG